MIKNYYSISVYLLVLIYIVLNVIYKKYINVFLLGSLFCIINFIIKDVINSIIIAYVISIMFGIYKNFHLLENFEDKEFNIMDDNNIVNKKNKKSKIKNTINSNKHNTNSYLRSKNQNRQGHGPKHGHYDDMPFQNDIDSPKNMGIKNNIVLKDVNIKSLISDELLEKFISYLKSNFVSIIYNKQVNIVSLKPTIKNLNINKVNSLSKTYDTSKERIKPIVISKDNFIVDGHHRWYSKKNLLDDYNIDRNKNFNKISATIIDLNINDIVKRIEKFKSSQNNSLINNFNIDKKRVTETQKCINTIKENIEKIQSYYTDFNQIKLL